MGRQFLAATMGICAIWYGWHWQTITFSWLTFLHLFLWLFLGAGIGKLVGILAFRFHSRKINLASKAATP